MESWRSFFMLRPEQKKFLSTHFSKVQYKALLKHYTRFRIGGPAEAIVFPENIEQVSSLLLWLAQENIPWLVIGGGSNILFDDIGFRGIIVSLTGCQSIQWHSQFVVAEGGVSLKFLWLHAFRKALGGMNFALGIPGTLGGAIRMNAGAHNGQISDIIESIDCVTSDGKRHHIKKNDLKIHYRQIDWDHIASGGVVVQSKLSLSVANTRLLREDARKKMIHRRKTQPIGCVCAGSFFKNPPGDYSAGFLIERAGLKGYHIGDAAVSKRHANFIVNNGNATYREIKKLMHYIQDRVLSQFNIQLTPEVKIIHA
ncbi:UDP-N-acetylenolpyruvoylglucosamine reductase [Candidatus Magnetomorum sp. HK-1]|nr:UDP-N-acetylenolpyruvoylglucosamine reductase [Candidatus Magnetomorum sp. HK-1]